MDINQEIDEKQQIAERVYYQASKKYSTKTRRQNKEQLDQIEERPVL